MRKIVQYIVITVLVLVVILVTYTYVENFDNGKKLKRAAIEKAIAEMPVEECPISLNYREYIAHCSSFELKSYLGTDMMLAMLLSADTREERLKLSCRKGNGTDILTKCWIIGYHPPLGKKLTGREDKKINGVTHLTVCGFLVF